MVEIKLFPLGKDSLRDCEKKTPKKKSRLLDTLVKDGVITPNIAKKLMKEARESWVSKKELPDTAMDIVESEVPSGNHSSIEIPETIDSGETKVRVEHIIYAAE